MVALKIIERKRLQPNKIVQSIALLPLSTYCPFYCHSNCTRFEGLIFLSLAKMSDFALYTDGSIFIAYMEYFLLRKQLEALPISIEDSCELTFKSIPYFYAKLTGLYHGKYGRKSRKRSRRRRCLHFYCKYGIFSTTKRLEALSISIEDSCIYIEDSCEVGFNSIG